MLCRGHHPIGEMELAWIRLSAPFILTVTLGEANLFLGYQVSLGGFTSFFIEAEVEARRQAGADSDSLDRGDPGSSLEMKSEPEAFGRRRFSTQSKSCRSLR